MAWSQFEPSGVLTDLLSGLDVGRLDADEALETAAAWEWLVAHAQAQQFRALARFASLQEGPDSDEEVAPVPHLSRSTAGARLDLATRLCTQLPDTLTELQSGTIDLLKARAISEATEVLDEPATAAVQARVLPEAATQTVGELRAALSRAVLAVDPDAANRPVAANRPTVATSTTVAHDRGGPTAPGNLGPLCRHHHRLKTRSKPTPVGRYPNPNPVYSSGPVPPAAFITSVRPPYRVLHRHPATPRTTTVLIRANHAR